MRQTKIMDLKTEYLSNPIGIDTDLVRFMWRMESNEIGVQQAAYQIRVTLLGKVVWDSGKVENSHSVGICYDGQPLKEGGRYVWNVTVWTEKGNKLVSESASFETGVSNQTEWNAIVYYMEYMKSQERGENQAPVAGDRNFGDWLSFQGTSVEVISDYYYGYMAKLMSRIGGIIGDKESQEKYNQKFEGIKNTFLQTHVTFDKGKLLIKSGTGKCDERL